MWAHLAPDPRPADNEGGQKEEADHVVPSISATHAAKTSGVSSAISSRDISDQPHQNLRDCSSDRYQKDRPENESPDNGDEGAD